MMAYKVGLPRGRKAGGANIEKGQMRFGEGGEKRGFIGARRGGRPLWIQWKGPPFKGNKFSKKKKEGEQEEEGLYLT